MSESNLNELLADLPAKQRVHELAKRAGLSSKVVLAALAQAGYVAKSSQSSVDAHYAGIALNALLGGADEPRLDGQPAPGAQSAEGTSGGQETATAESSATEPELTTPALAEPVTAEPVTAEPVTTAADESSSNTAESVPAESAASTKPKRSRGGRSKAAKAAPEVIVEEPANVPDIFSGVEATVPAEASRPAAGSVVNDPASASTAESPLSVALLDLPPRSRVHELAKRAGISAKVMIATLAEQGVVVKSANSVIAQDAAVQALTSLLNAAPESSPTVRTSTADWASLPAETSTNLTEPVFDLEAAFTAPVSTPEFSTPDVAVGPIFISPDESARPTRRRRGRGSDRVSSGSTESAASTEAEPNLLDLDSILDAAVAAGTVAVPATTASEQDAEVGQAEDENSDESRRRRRRGRRGRGRTFDRDTDDRPAAGAETTDEGESAEAVVGSGIDEPIDSAVETAEGDEEDSDGADGADDETGSGGVSASRRRRRRRSRGTSGDDGPRVADDPIDTVVHVREPKSVESQVQGVRGSTRLEAKRQRRRDSRDTRRRPQILTEAEFLARRESVERVMTVRQRGDLAQVALLEDGVLVEHFVSRAGSASMIGNVYLGRVQNVLPSMEAAFVDIGRGRNAVLYAGEVNWDAAGLAGKSRKIETALSSGDTLLVQVSKDPVGHKGSRLTTQISLPGRFLVYVPNGGATGISRKLPDTERRRLKAILDRIVPEDAGVIIRTAAEGVSEEELARDVERLQLQWAEISKRASQKSNAPEQLYSEPDTLIKVIRDLFNSDITKLIIDGEQAYESLSSYVQQVAPELADRVSKFEGRTDVFAAHRIDEQIAKALERKVHLPSGGSLVIDRTEAMTVVDVNTGKYTGSGGNLEETVTKNNLEAAEEVVRQLRLRDIGGIIVVDFIDMVLESNRDLVLRRLTECLGRDRTRHQVAEVTSLGLIQMTRKKMGTGLVEAFSEPCEHCHGRGIVLHDVPIDMGVPEFAIQPPVADRGNDRRRRGRDGGRDTREAGRDVPVIEAEAIALAASLPQVTPPQRDPRGPKPPSFAEKKAAREAEEKLTAENLGSDNSAGETSTGEIPDGASVSSGDSAEPGAAEPQAAERAVPTLIDSDPTVESSTEILESVAEGNDTDPSTDGTGVSGADPVFGGVLVGEAAESEGTVSVLISGEDVQARQPNWDEAATADQDDVAGPEADAEDAARAGSAEPDEGSSVVEVAEVPEAPESEDVAGSGRSGRRRGGRGRKKHDAAARNGRADTNGASNGNGATNGASTGDEIPNGAPNVSESGVPSSDVPAGGEQDRVSDTRPVVGGPADLEVASRSVSDQTRSEPAAVATATIQAPEPAAPVQRRRRAASRPAGPPQNS